MGCGSGSSRCCRCGGDAIAIRVASRALGRPNGGAFSCWSLVGNTKNAVQLVRAHALFRARHETDGLKHLAKRNVGTFENRADANSKLLAAIAAFPQTDPRLVQVVMLARDRTAVSANRTIRPETALKIGKGYRLIVKVG